MAESSLAQENSRLKDELAALKERYGIPDDHSKEKKRKKNKEVFDSFDADASGQIDSAEFQQLCYECGVVIAPENLDGAIAQIDTDGDGVISFDEWNNWLLKYEEEAKDDEGDMMAMLRLRLLGKRLYRRASVMKNSINDANIRREVEGEGEQDKTVNWDLNISVGKGEELRSGIYLKFHGTEAERDEARVKSGVPDECPSLVYVDLGLRPDASDMDVGGLVALLKNHIGEMPQLNPEGGIYHSHSVTVAEEDGERRVRIALYSTINPMEMGEGAIGVNPVHLVNRAEISIESGLDLGAFKQENYNIVGNLAGKLLMSFEIDPFAIELAEKIGEAVGKGPKPGMSFFRRANTEIEFNSIYDLVASYDGYDERMDALAAQDVAEPGPPGGAGAPPGVGGPQKPSRVPMPVRALQSVPPGPELIEKLQDLLSLGLQNIPPPLKDTYESLRKCVSGLRYIRMQADIAGFGLTVKGLDFGEYLPELPAPEEGGIEKI